MYERNHKLLYSKVRQYLIPAILMKLALQLGNVVDTMLVGNILGKDAMTAVGLVLPVISMVQIPAYFLGNGGAVYAGILLGRRRKQEACELFTSLFWITIFLNAIFSCSSFFISKPLAHLMCGESGMEKEVASCVSIYLLCSPVFCLGVFLSRFVSADSHPKIASAYYIISNMVNLLLDFIFLRFTDLGVKGAALSTVMGFTFGLIVTVLYIRSTRRMLEFSRLKLSVEMLKATLSAGMPHISYLLLVMVKGFVLNTIVLAWLKENGIVVYTVCNSTGLILKMCIGGIMEVIPYTVSILYGEKDFSGIRAVVLTNDALCHDFTIRSCVEDAVGVAQKIQHFCKSYGIDKGKANMIAVAAEEMAVNIARYGGQKSQWIDICITIEEKTDSEVHGESLSHCITLRLRDNGNPFDPTVYEEDGAGMEYEIHGINLVKTMAKSITYIRAMDLNNTTITI